MAAGNRRHDVANRNGLSGRGARGGARVMKRRALREAHGQHGGERVARTGGVNGLNPRRGNYLAR